VEHSPQNRELPDRDLVVRIVDGDTVILERVGRVRLIGVDTPETVAPGKAEQPFGREASEFTGRLLLGKPVRIEYGRNKRDRYDRALAYVYLLDGTFVNAEIIKHGYGVAYTRFPFKHMGEFVKIEREARENGRGMWASDSHNSPEARSR
jgi:micrococcal nuclease